MLNFMDHIFRVICNKRKVIAGEDGDSMYRRLVEACSEDICDELEYTEDVTLSQKETFLGHLAAVATTSNGTTTAIDVDV